MLNNQTLLYCINIVLCVIALGLLVPSTILFIECMASLLPNRSQAENFQSPKPRTTVLVPAHNEAPTITLTLDTLLPQLTDRDKLVVIADNCTDETAVVVRNLGATAIERQDQEHRGKGYALDYGLRFLEKDPPEVVIFVDADCLVEAGTVERISRLAATLGRPVQATYLMKPPTNPGTKDLVSALAVMVSNLVRPSGLAKLGLPCVLRGTGMAFPWSVISKVPLASSNLVEDLQLGLDLAIAGHPPVFCRDGKLTAVLPQQGQAAKGQRTRWEHGSLQTMFTQVPRLLKIAVLQRRFDLFANALDLCVPPLSLLVMMWAAATGGALLVGVLEAVWLPVLLLTLAGFMIIFSIIGAWAKFGRADLPLLTLLAVPFYILWKIPLYLAFLVRPQTEWIRTKRDVVESSES